MNAVVAIPDISQLAKLAAPGGEATPNVAPEQVSKFADLMKRNEVQSTDAASGDHTAIPGHNVVGEMMERQQLDMKRLDSEMDKFMADAPNMDIRQLSAAQMHLTNEFTMTGVRLTIATSVTQDANKSLQSLVKPQ